MVDFIPHVWNGVEVTDQMACKLRIFTVWPLTENVCQPLVYWRRLDDCELLEESKFYEGEKVREQHRCLLVGAP